jgi:urease accessory protein
VFTGAQPLPSGQALWHLLQTSDQFFPTGGFAFSHALEMYVAAGLVYDRATCQRLFIDLFNHAMGPTDLVFCAHAHRLAAGPDDADVKLSSLVDLDCLLAATKVPRELRLESQHIGRSFLRAAMALSPSPLSQSFWQQVQRGASPGHHAAAFGLVAHELGSPETTAVLAATKVPRELRLESQHIGRSFLRAAMALSPSPLAQAFWQQVQRGASPGHHAAAFGLVAHELGSPETTAVLAYLYTVASSLVAAAVRLVPLGQSDGQRLLHELQPCCLELVQRYAHLTPEDAWNGAPGLDIRSMQHERLYSRLCRS